MKTYEIELTDGRKVQFDWEGEGEPSNRIYQEVIDSIQKPGTISTAPPTWVEPGRAAVTSAGAIGGGAAGTPLGPAGQAGGAALGAAGTGQAYDRLLEMLGVTKPQTPQETFSTAGKEILMFGAAEAAPMVISPIANAILARMPWAKKGMNAASQRLLRIAKEEGIDLPAPAITGEHGQAAVYQTLGNYPTSIGTIEKEVGNAFLQMEKQGERFVSKKGFGVTPLQAGQTAQTGISLKYQRVKAQGDKLYQVALERGKNAPISLSESNRIGQEILTSDEFDLLPQELQSTIKTIINKTSKEVPASESKILDVLGKPAFKTEASIEEVKRTLDQVDELRKAIGERSGYEDVYKNNAERLFRKISDAIDKDVIASTETVNPQASKAYQAARDFQRKNIFGKFKGVDEFKQKAMGESVLRQDPSLVLREADTVTGIKQMSEVMNPNYFDVVRRGKIAEFIEPTIKEVDTIYGKATIFDGDQLEKMIYQKMSPEYRAILFKPDELIALDRVIQVSQSMKSMVRLGGSQSGTPKGMFFGRLLTGGVPAGGAGYLIGGVPGVIVGTTLATAGPWGVAKFITSEAGKRYLIEGIKIGPKLTTAMKTGAYMMPSWMRQREKAEIPSNQ